MISEDDERVFKSEIIELLIEYKAGYMLINGKFEIDKSLQISSSLEQLVENQLLIQSLHLKNVSLFEDIEIRLDPTKRVTCFIGGNGSGKTTLLRGLVGATTFKPEELNLLMIREAKKSQLYQKEGFITLNYLFHGEEAQNEIHFRAFDLDKRFKVKNGNGKRRFLINANDDLLKTLIIGFSQQTGTTPSKALEGFNPKLQDIEALILNKPDGRFYEFSTWLKNLLIAPADRVANQVLLERIFKVINQVTQAGLELTSHTDAYVKTKDNPEGIPIDLVSQGYKNVLAWLGFFMKRLWEYGQTLSFRVDDFTKLPAICLIDEIDTYLHPKWQNNILSTLVDTFPNVQFIVTTHSPYIVGSIPKDLIQLYICDKQTVEPFTLFSPYGANIERLTERIFETPARVQAIAQDVADLRKAIQNNDFEKADQLLQSLEELGVGDDDNDPEIGSLKILLRTQKRKAGI